PTPRWTSRDSSGWRSSSTIATTATGPTRRPATPKRCTPAPTSWSWSIPTTSTIRRWCRRSSSPSRAARPTSCWARGSRAARRSLHAPPWRGLARGLDGAALVLAALAVAVLAAGRVRLGGVTLERAEDLVVVLALVVGARLALAPVALPRISPRALVAGGVAIYVLAMGVVVVTRHVALRTHALDLGYYVQVVWNLAHGNGARVTLP